MKALESLRTSRALDLWTRLKLRHTALASLGSLTVKDFSAAQGDRVLFCPWSEGLSESFMRDLLVTWECRRTCEY